MRRVGLAVAALVAASALVCAAEAASLRHGRGITERGESKVERELAAEVAEFETEPSASELAKVKVPAEAMATEEAEPKEEGPKLGKPGWRKLVQELSDEVSRAAQQLRDNDADSLKLREVYFQEKKEGIDEEEIARAKRIADEARQALDQQRLKYHILAGRLADQLQRHPTVAEGEWAGSVEDPLWAPAMQLVRTATYDGTWIQNEKAGPVEDYTDPKHTYQGETLWGQWKPGKEHPSPSKILERLG